METLDKAGMGDRIKQIRKAAGLRQWQLAAELGTTQSAVHKYEHGVIPEPRRLILLSRLGNTTLEWILCGRHTENGSITQQRPSADVYRLAERLQAFGSEERKRLDEATRIMGEVVGALYEPTPFNTDEPLLTGKEQLVLAAARRVHRAVLNSVLDQTLERLDSTPSPADGSAQPPARGGKQR